jgi:hypothetical protein
VAFGTSDFLAEDQIKIVVQNWLVTPLKPSSEGIGG